MLMKTHFKELDASIPVWFYQKENTCVRLKRDVLPARWTGGYKNKESWSKLNALFLFNTYAFVSEFCKFNKI